MFGRLFNKKPPEPAAHFVIAKLNARLQPMHRGEFFEDPLDAVLKEHLQGDVSGGGTMQAVSGEIEYCDLELLIPAVTPGALALIATTLEKLGAPKGSKLTVESTDETTCFGTAEGLAVYLNGTDLPQETYRDCDSNHVYAEFDRLLEGMGRVLSWWQGPTETAFYMYGTSFEEMQKRLAEFLATYPLCARSRVVQIA